MNKATKFILKFAPTISTILLFVFICIPFLNLIILYALLESYRNNHTDKTKKRFYFIDDKLEESYEV